MSTDSMTHVAGKPGLARFLFGMRPSQIGLATVYFLLGFPLAIVAFVLPVVVGSTGVPLLIIYPVGLLFVGLWIVVVRSSAVAQRWLVETFLETRIEPPPKFTPEGGWHQRLWAWAMHRDTWRYFGYFMARLPVAIFTFTLTIVVWSVPVGLLSIPVRMLLLGADFGEIGVWLVTALGLIAGVAMLPFIPLVLRSLAHIDIALATALLGRSAKEQLGVRVDELSTSRSRMVDAAENERRRIERDLHDGAGQQLVSLAMLLGMAREKMAHDPQAAAQLLDEAHTGAKEALSGLRDIVRGISPAILNDRGLGAALSAISARSSVPVSVNVNVDRRPGPTIEGIAYYIVCEAISNAVRHTRPNHINVKVVRTDDVLEVEVTDDGQGGADPARGTGLRGLADRVAAIDGGLEITSPVGGPTIIRALLPAGRRESADHDAQSTVDLRADGSQEGIDSPEGSK
ncbi:sensor histidine kinase [Natronoglycomyces albus]|uniref:histidine kinase n=1 Tax=Natronoglycomyces albus TaxID=2811108 RepID=A0A895XKI8_9ACTN|nr:sensor histidine kinase [Natronoglycomyces albus]QSB05567.1 sensor histidine kinase [Natronoglycomyces albus]